MPPNNFRRDISRGLFSGLLTWKIRSMRLTTPFQDPDSESRLVKRTDDPYSWTAQRAIVWKIGEQETDVANGGGRDDRCNRQIERGIIRRVKF